MRRDGIMGTKFLEIGRGAFELVLLCNAVS
jgi:hypothetical protein